MSRLFINQDQAYQIPAEQIDEVAIWCGKLTLLDKLKSNRAAQFEEACETLIIGRQDLFEGKKPGYINNFINMLCHNKLSK